MILPVFGYVSARLTPWISRQDFDHRTEEYDKASSISIGKAFSVSLDDKVPETDNPFINVMRDGKSFPCSVVVIKP